MTVAEKLTIHKTIEESNLNCQIRWLIQTKRDESEETNMGKTQIGWFVVEQERTFHDAGYECAAWWQDVLVKAGKYPAYVYDMRVREDGQLDVHGVYASMDGTVVADYFGSLYCGVPISSYDKTKNAGKAATYSTFSYDWMVADDILRGETRNGCHYELLPEYEAKRYSFFSQYDGHDIELCGLFKRLI